MQSTQFLKKLGSLETELELRYESQANYTPVDDSVWDAADELANSGVGAVFTETYNGGMAWLNLETMKFRSQRKSLQ